jgi:murein DD-endopeptidase MepM/ murein hydrolase activator NlpD
MPAAILPTRRGPSAFLYRDPEGAPASNGRTYHGALDWFAPGGTDVRAPVDGVIVEVRPSGGDRSGQVYGGTVKLAERSGRVYVMRHVEPVARLGAEVRVGALLARVTEWAENPGSSHVHLEVWRGLAGGYALANMIDPGLLGWTAYVGGPRPRPREERPPGRTLRLALPGHPLFAGWGECAGPLKWIAAHGLATDACALAWQKRVYRGRRDVTNVAINLTRRFL